MITEQEVFKALDLIQRYKNQETDSVELIIEKNKDTRSIDCLELDKRAFNTLRYHEVKTIGELLSFGRFDLIRFRNMGKQTIKIINKALELQGFKPNYFSETE